jgi:hypothetical protein
VLGGGLDLVTVGARTYIRSVPVELNTDVNHVLELAEVGGGKECGAVAVEQMHGPLAEVAILSVARRTAAVSRLT